MSRLDVCGVVPRDVTAFFLGRCKYLDLLRFSAIELLYFCFSFELLCVCIDNLVNSYQYLLSVGLGHAHKRRCLLCDEYLI